MEALIDVALEACGKKSASYCNCLLLRMSCGARPALRDSQQMWTHCRGHVWRKDFCTKYVDKQ